MPSSTVPCPVVPCAWVSCGRCVAELQQAKHCNELTAQVKCQQAEMAQSAAQLTGKAGATCHAPCGEGRNTAALV